MPAQLRVLRRRIRTVQSTKKITRAMELIAASRIIKAQGRVDAARPYTAQLITAIEAAATVGAVDHPLLLPARSQERAAVLLITADRGLAGGYSANAIRAAESLGNLLRREGKGGRLLHRRPQGHQLLPIPQSSHRRGMERVLGESDVPGCPDDSRRPHRAVPAAHK